MGYKYCSVGSVSEWCKLRRGSDPSWKHLQDWGWSQDMLHRKNIIISSAKHAASTFNMSDYEDLASYVYLKVINIYKMMRCAADTSSPSNSLLLPHLPWGKLRKKWLPYHSTTHKHTNAFHNYYCRHWRQGGRSVLPKDTAAVWTRWERKIWQSSGSTFWDKVQDIHQLPELL